MSHTDTLLLVICIIMGVAVLLQIGFLISIAVMGGRALKMVREYGDEFRSAATPALHNARELLEASKTLIARLEPRLDAAASDLAEMAQVAREETRKIQASADEISERIRRQAERMDNMTTGALDGVDRVGHFVNHAVTVPVRQAAGILAAVKAIVDALRSSAPPRRRTAQNAHADD
jgi:methyl-accepting chemotaxis protein